MKEGLDVATVVILSALSLLLLIGLAVLLLIIVHQRRMRHRADVMEIRVRHADEVRTVEREVQLQTLSEVGLELHDNVGQLLTALRLDVNALLATTPTNSVATGMKSTLDKAIAEIRRLSHTLNTDRLRERPLGDVLEEECRRLHRPGEREVVFFCSTPPPVVEPDHTVVLFRIFQEAMNNALKHAGASRITVMLTLTDQLSLGIEDNGSGQGLSNIRKRADLIGFHCHIDSKPGRGTIVRISQ
jgi:two-component system, NarL family, sensor kinase